MKSLARAAIAVAMLVLATVGVSLPATAAAGDPSPDTTYGCLQETGDYGAQPVCQLQVAAASALCLGDVPYVQYALVPTGTPNTTATLTFDNPDGADVVYTDLPLTGTVLWPGATVDANGKPTDWPGWTKNSDGTWVKGDSFDWATGALNLTFEVNPSATVTLAYPPATAVCAGPPTSIVLAAEDPAPAAAVLSATGSNVAPLLIAGASLVGLGALLLLARGALRRRKVTIA